jgi:hypothetical protein
MHQAGLLAQPHFQPSRLRSGLWRKWPRCGRDGLYSYGDSAGMEPDFPFNEFRLHDLQP